METEPRQLELFDTASYAAAPGHVAMTEEPQVLPSVTGVNFTPQGLIVADATNMQPEAYNAIFRSVIRFAKASNWLLGDTLLLCERRWGAPQAQSKYAEAMAATGLSNGTLRNIVATCRAFPPEARHERLSFSHHQETACIQSTAEERESFLTLAESEGYSCTELRNPLRQIVQEKEQNTAPEESVAPNSDRPFGLLPLPTQEDADCAIPCALELSRFTFWASQHPATSLPKEHRAELLSRLQPIVEYASELNTTTTAF
jgi:hypothetical protein